VIKYGRSDGKVIWHPWRGNGKCIQNFGWKTSNKREDSFGYLGIYGKMTLTFISRDRVRL